MTTEYQADGNTVYAHHKAGVSGPFQTVRVATATDGEEATRIADALNAPRFLYQVWNAGNDTNGNPRRVTQVYHARTAMLVASLDDGYSGDHVPGGARQLPTVYCTPGEYKQALRDEAARKVARKYLDMQFTTQIDAIGLQARKDSSLLFQLRERLKSCGATKNQMRDVDALVSAIWSVEAHREAGAEYTAP